MVRASPVLYKRLTPRLRLTTKQVNKGYYKGSGTGSMGAHTEYGNYVIDYRKVRHYNCPDLTGFKVCIILEAGASRLMSRQLSPFVTKEKESSTKASTKPDGRKYLQSWYENNKDEVKQLFGQDAYGPHDGQSLKQS